MQGYCRAMVKHKTNKKAVRNINIDRNIKAWQIDKHYIIIC